MVCPVINKNFYYRLYHFYHHLISSQLDWLSVGEKSFDISTFFAFIPSKTMYIEILLRSDKTMEMKLNKSDWIFLILCLVLGITAEEAFFRDQIGISYLVFIFIFY